MNIFWKCVVFGTWLIVLPLQSAAESSDGEISAALMPAEVLAPSAEMDVDWEIEDISYPKTPFEKAVAGKLAAIGVSRTISVTYDLPKSEGTLFSFEAYEFSRELSLEDAFGKLKPGVLDRGRVEHTTINGFPALAVKFSPQGPEVRAVTIGKMLYVLGAPNTVTADLSWFVGKYFEWYTSKSK